VILPRLLLERSPRSACLLAVAFAVFACGDERPRVLSSTVAPGSAALLPAPGARALPALPTLLSSDPARRAQDVPRSEWLRLVFASDVADGAEAGVVLLCDGAPHPASAFVLGAREVVLNPAGELPAAAACELRWRSGSGVERLAFGTAGAGVPAFVHYDRRDRRAAAPFPDDFWLRAAEPGGDERLAIELTGFSDISQSLVDAFVADTRGLDGFSPIAHLTVELSEPPDPASLPLTPAASVDPLSPVVLFDLTPGSAGYGTRMPFRLEARSDRLKGRAPSHVLLLYPSQPLAPGGRYGLVVTRRVRVSAARPFEPSPFFARVIERAPAAGEAPALARVRPLADEVLDAVASATFPPIPREDVALALRISVRSTRDIPSDLLAIREEIFRAPPPAVSVESVEPESAAALAAGSQVAAVIHGTWQAPDFRGEDGSLARDPLTRRPLRTDTRPLGFVLALPAAAQGAPVPVTLYQHGNPGSAEEEVVEHARRSLAAQGFAVIGFTDVMNREVSPPGIDVDERAKLQTSELLLHLLWHRHVPDIWVETNAEQLAFLRAIEELARVPRFALAAGEGSEPIELFGIDGAQPLTLEGVSEGASLATSLLPYAPEVRAASLVAGGRRYSEVLMHQQADRFLEELSLLGFGDLTPADVWVALALFQTLLDPQDPHVHAPFLWRERLALPGSARRASVLLVEGTGDTFVPNHATEALAAALGGVPMLEPGRPLVPGIATVRAPLAANIDGETTGALVQWTPLGVAGREPTPGCSDPLAGLIAWEGHHCAQGARESRSQRAAFLASALGGGAPVVVDPLEN
jgi:hypothetical protein